MTQNTFKVHEKSGQITLIELDSMTNYLPVTDETYLRIIHGLSDKGLVKLPMQEKNSKTRR